MRLGRMSEKYKAAVRRADRPFREHEPFLHQARLDARRHHARYAARRLRRNRQGEEPDQRHRASGSAPSRHGTLEMPLGLHGFLPTVDEQRLSIFEHAGTKRKCHFRNSDAPCWESRSGSRSL